MRVYIIHGKAHNSAVLLFVPASQNMHARNFFHSGKQLGGKHLLALRDFFPADGFQIIDRASRIDCPCLKLMGQFGKYGSLSRHTVNHLPAGQKRRHLL